MFEIIKQYMVSLGATVDKKSFAGAEVAVKGLEKTLSKLIKTGKVIASAAAAMVAALAAVTAGAWQFANSTAQADRKVSMLARRLMTTKENARSLDVAMRAMKIGSLDELREIGLDPEQKKQFLELKALARSLEDPRSGQSMKEIRALNFEFQKMQVRFEYFKMEFAGKMFDGLKKVKPYIQSLVNLIMPLVKPLQDMGKDGGKVLQIFWNWLQKCAKFIMPVTKTIRALITFAIKGWQLIFRYIQMIAPTFEASFRVVRTVLDPIMKIFRFAEDLIVYLAGGKSHREKGFDKLPYLRNIRQQTTGIITNNQRMEEQKEIQKKADDGALKNITMGTTTQRKFNERLGDFNNIPVGGREKNQFSQAQQLALGTLSNMANLEGLGLNITSGMDGDHGKNSAHYKGLATDIQGSAYAVARLAQEAIKSAQFQKLLIEGTAAQKAAVVAELDKMGVSKKNYDVETLNRNKNVNPVLHMENKTLQELLQQNRQVNYNVAIYADKNPKATYEEFLVRTGQSAISPVV